MNITRIKGIGEKTAALFSKLNITDTSSLVTYYPRDYDYFEPALKINEVTEGIHAVEAKCTCQAVSRYVRGKSITSCRIGDDTGEMGIVFFNMPYVKNALKAGTLHVFRGVISKKGNTYIFTQPKMYTTEDYAKLSDTWQPVYSTTKGLSSASIQKAVSKAYRYEEGCLSDESADSPLCEKLPPEILQKRDLIPLKDAVYNIHFPASRGDLIAARNRLAYQEFFDYLMNIEKNRAGSHRQNMYPMIEVAETSRLIQSLPYKLTEDQTMVWNTIKNDLMSPNGCFRIVQGDVGSGKTIVSFLALIMAACNGMQAALMAPTEVLAVQHYENMVSLLAGHGIKANVCLLTGSVKGKARREILERIQTGDVSIIIGTHALFQEKVDYKALSLVITDEQHRFGVKEREALADKGGVPNVLMMSATPIPRTLAMILYGDLDISAIHSMPSGRLPIKNCVVDTSFRPQAYKFIMSEVDKGNQVYIICPQVESGEMPGLTNVVDYASDLKSELPEKYRIAYLHGKMKPAQKESVMYDFAKGETDILVSTTVVEVGVNVPNATVMYVENAERFGLAQLHQLRGRVGRSDMQSYCIFMMGNASDDSKERLRILEENNDGFVIAEKDMSLRGPGDIFGIRQSGELSFMIGDIYQDHELICQAAEDVKYVLSK